MIEQVEKFAAELKLLLLTYRKVAAQRYVEIHKAAGAKDILSLVAEVIERWLAERVGVEPVVEAALVRRKVGVAQNVGAERAGGK